MNKAILNIILFLVASTSLLSCNKKANDETWRFINAPDMHNVEGFSNAWKSAWENNFESYEEFRRSRIDEISVDFKRIQTLHQAELFISPGDCNGGRWDRRWGTKFRENFRSVSEYAHLSNEDIILEASELCYSALNEIIYSSGYKEFLMAVGDHEIGDNPWPKGSETPALLSFYRQGFANSFTLKSPGGETRFDKPIGNALPKPVGTIYENTSNAVQYKNVLFITLDVFRYDGEDIVLGEEGLICGDISGKHLEWLESVLKEAQNIPSINHIIVQAHLPIIYPVRKYASSGMLMTGTSDNVLLKTMRKYKVDLYLAGEVHMNTITKDPESDLIQFVGRGNGLSNYSVVEVAPGKLGVKCYKNDGSQIGELIIDKSGANKAISGSGELKLFDPNGLHVHWTFDEKTNKDDFSSNIGNFPYKNGIIAFDKQNEEPFVIMNNGQLGNAYSLFGDGAELVDGIVGKALEINQHSKLLTIAMGPMYDDFERTISCWINTSVRGRRLILNSNSQWRPNGQFFNVGLNEGRMEIAIRPEIYATGKTRLNDGKWHHIAIVVPKREATLADCKMYIDGEPENDISCQNGESLIDTEQSNWMTIATQSNAFRTDLGKTMNMSDFTGKIDDFCMWTRPLNIKEIESIYNSGLKGKSAVEID